MDVLRGISIALVILLHINIHFSGPGLAPRRLLPPWLYHLLFTNGDHGVTLFFAISGFLITFTTIRRFGSLAAMRPAVFYRIRLARIAPLLLLLLAVLSVLHLAHVENFVISRRIATLPRALFAALTFHINWLEASAHGYLPANWDVLWSLSVEELFYLVFPLACVLLYRKRASRPLFFVVLAALIVAGPFPRSYRNPNPIWADDSYLGGMDAIAFGCLTALATAALQRGRTFASAHARTVLIGLQIAGAAILLRIGIWPRFALTRPAMNAIGRHGLDDTLLAIATCLIMAASVLRGQPGRRLTAPIRWLGRHSYELYLTHSFFVVTGAIAFHRLHQAAALSGAPAGTPAATHQHLAALLTAQTVAVLCLWSALIFVASIALAALTARFFTEPANRLLRGAAPPEVPAART